MTRDQCKTCKHNDSLPRKHLVETLGNSKYFRLRWWVRQTNPRRQRQHSNYSTRTEMATSQEKSLQRYFKELPWKSISSRPPTICRFQRSLLQARLKQCSRSLMLMGMVAWVWKNSNQWWRKVAKSSLLLCIDLQYLHHSYLFNHTINVWLGLSFLTLDFGLGLDLDWTSAWQLKGDLIWRDGWSAKRSLYDHRGGRGSEEGLHHEINLWCRTMSHE